MGIEATFAREPGGLYQVTRSRDTPRRGEFVELDPPRRLVYTWGWEPSEDGPTPCRPARRRSRSSSCRKATGRALRFVHAGLPTAEAIATHAHGWDHYLARLAVAAGGGDPGRDPWLDGDEECERHGNAGRSLAADDAAGDVGVLRLPRRGSRPARARRAGRQDAAALPPARDRRPARDAAQGRRLGAAGERRRAEAGSESARSRRGPAPTTIPSAAGTA